MLMRMLVLLAAACAAMAAPNIVVIVADDLGWSDVGWHGSKLKTPHLDKLVRTGLELDQHYVAPVCTPTRAGLLTGRYWSRFGVANPSNTQVLPFGAVTLASALRSAGYRTALAGKWHLGSKPESGPPRFGFDTSYGSLAGGVGPWDHRYKRGPYSKTWHRNGELMDEEGHVTDLIAREAVAFVERRRGRPFFLYVPFTAVHHPLEEPDRWLESNRHVAPERRQYAACVEHMDDAIGRIIAAIERTGDRHNTLVVFFSDNGGDGGTADEDTKKYPGSYAPGSVLGMNKPLRGHKGQLYEGGIRVPALASWPGRLESRKVTAPIQVVDWMPTLTRLAGYKPRGDMKWDGVDIWGILAGETEPAARVLYWEGPNGRSHALRKGSWKLLTRQGQVELFNLAQDPYEQTDLAQSQPETVQKLKALLEQQQALDDDAEVSP
ncbi:MAG: sulfatase-like hydrolase/transferase [bacterium]|nr:sulfatase-like hydrolase/transferase [bacterium]